MALPFWQILLIIVSAIIIASSAGIFVAVGVLLWKMRYRYPLRYCYDWCSRCCCSCLRARPRSAERVRYFVPLRPPGPAHAEPSVELHVPVTAPSSPPTEREEQEQLTVSSPPPGQQQAILPPASDGAEQDQPPEQPPDPPCVPLSLSPSHPPSLHGTSSHESLPKKDVQCASSLSTVQMCIRLCIYNLPPIQQHNQPRESAVAPTLDQYEPPHVPSLASAVSYDVKPAAEPPRRKHRSVSLAGPGQRLVSFFRQQRASAYARLSHVC